MNNLTRLGEHIRDTEDRLRIGNARRSELLAAHARGVASARNSIDELDAEMATWKSGLAIDKAALAAVCANATTHAAETRRAAARKTADSALALLRKTEEDFAAVDDAVEALAAAMTKAGTTAKAASAAVQQALSLAIPNAQQRMTHFGTMAHLADPDTGNFPVAAATALRQIFATWDSPERAYTTPSGLTLPINDRLPFAAAAKWAADTVGPSLTGVVERACQAEEALPTMGALA